MMGENGSLKNIELGIEIPRYYKDKQMINTILRKNKSSNTFSWFMSLVIEIVFDIVWGLILWTLVYSADRWIFALDVEWTHNLEWFVLFYIGMSVMLDFYRYNKKTNL